MPNPSIEGANCDNWMLVDCGNVIVHAFSAEGRAYFDLERKWAFEKKEQFEPQNFAEEPIDSLKKGRLVRPKRKNRKKFKKMKMLSEAKAIAKWHNQPIID